MPIIRTYACPECMHMMDVLLTMEQVDDPPPDCPRCVAREAMPMRQEFKPFAIGGSASSQAHKIAEDIADQDYNVGNMQVAVKEGDVNKIRYKDQNQPITASKWGAAQEALEHAVAIGRQTRLQHGSGLDVLQSTLKSGAQPDLIEASKRRAIKVW